MPRKKLEEVQNTELQTAEAKPVKRRGRPPKAETIAKRAKEAAQAAEMAESATETTAKAAAAENLPQGQAEETAAEVKPVKRRGRPPKAETLAKRAREEAALHHRRHRSRPQKLN